MNVMKCICINDKNKPDNIPQSHWITQDKEYIIKRFEIIDKAKGIVGVILKDIDLTEINTSFTAFSIERFMFTTEASDMLLNLLSSTFGIDVTDVKHLLKDPDFKGFNISTSLKTDVIKQSNIVDVDIIKNLGDL